MYAVMGCSTDVLVGTWAWTQRTTGGKCNKTHTSDELPGAFGKAWNLIIVHRKLNVGSAVFISSTMAIIRMCTTLRISPT